MIVVSRRSRQRDLCAVIVCSATRCTYNCDGVLVNAVVGIDLGIGVGHSEGIGISFSCEGAGVGTILVERVPHRRFSVREVET